MWHAGSRVQAQQLWCMGLVALRHVGSSWTRARTHVPCIGTRILNHCATREALTMVCLFFFFFFFYWLHWVFIAARGLSLVAASGGYSSLQCAGLSLRWLLLLRNTGSRHMGSVVVAHGLSCSAACGILPDQGPNPCSLHWQADS